MVVERPVGSTSGSATLHHVLPVERMRGCRIAFSAWIKAEQVSAPPQPWNGVKFMAPIQTPGGYQWPAAHIEAGTFAWKHVTFSVRVPDDAQSMSLIVGLESVTGKAWFDDIRVWLLKTPIARPKQAAAGPVYRGHDLPRLRGAMVGPKIGADGLRTFGRQWNANVIRWQLVRPARAVEDALDLAAYDAWLDAELDRLDAVLPVCRQAGLYVVVDLHSPPGGRVCSGGYAAADAGLFNNADCQAKFVEVWRTIARRYKNAEAVWGYDLVNEPNDGSTEEGLADWQQLAERRPGPSASSTDGMRLLWSPRRAAAPKVLTSCVPSTFLRWSTVFICTGPWASPIRACLDQANRSVILASSTASNGIRPGWKWR